MNRGLRKDRRLREPRVVITGAGAVSPFGIGIGSLAEGITGGRATLVPIEGPAGWRSARCAALVADRLEPGPFAPNVWRRLDRCSRMVARAALEALAAAGLAVAALPEALPTLGEELGIVLGTMSAGTGPLRDFLATLFTEGPEAASPMLFPFTVPNAPASQCSILLGLKGPNLTLCQMEASGAGAIATAANLIRSGLVEAVLAGGADVHTGEIGEAWTGWRIAARGDAASYRGPFDRERRGFAPGEGAYLLVLETLERARGRGARVWAEVAGEAVTHTRGAAHRWPEGSVDPARAIEQALARAGLAPGDLGSIQASANGSVLLDRIEARGLEKALGAALRRIPVSSVKGGVGESAAGSACAVLTGALSIRDDFVPPVAGLSNPGPEFGLSLVVGSARRQSVPSVLVNSLGTGGTSVALVLARHRPSS
jgi:3-oxoacyl-(acyl-carrier-protein) synthase